MYKILIDIIIEKSHIARFSTLIWFVGKFLIPQHHRIYLIRFQVINNFLLNDSGVCDTWIKMMVERTAAST
ncbi:hypothetical protein PM8797T_28604 [Gimesia maris DSM 8797]|nr:hypothetical protein PM8797T_28604 [Gimesia maris DSM 8797]|tara:strand:+ start:23014 stop:23226 length:213 start_codon:yes stop_codon:yes gene_type:complete